MPEHRQLRLGCTIFAHLQLAVCALIDEPLGTDIAHAAGPDEEIGIRLDD